jgi:hypothetical protein
LAHPGSLLSAKQFNDGVALVNAALGNEMAYDPLWRDGAALTLEEAIAVALTTSDEIG